MLYLDTDEHILDAIDECYAAYKGSGTVNAHDCHRLKEKLAELVKEGRTEFQLTSSRFDDLIARYLHERYLFEEGGAFFGGYGFEDLCSFIDWLCNEMGVPR